MPVSFLLAGITMRVCSLVALLLSVCSAGAAPRVPTPDLQALLDAGKFHHASQALEVALTQTPDDDPLRLGLGMVRFLHSVERLGQSFHEYDYRNLGLPFFRLPIPKNPEPNRLSHERFRRVFDDFRRDLARPRPPCHRLPTRRSS